MRWLKNLLFGKEGAVSSIASMLRYSYIVLLLLMLIPAVVSVSMLVRYAYQYDTVVRQVERVASLKPLVQSEIPDEVWNIVAGHKTFDEGTQYETIAYVNAEIDALIAGAPTTETTELLVAQRTMKTLVKYVDRMGEQMRAERPVAENEALLEEVRNVSTLVADMLSDYADTEIGAAARTSDQLQSSLFLTLSILAALFVVTLAFCIVAQRKLSAIIHAPIARLETFAGALAGGDLLARAPETSVLELRSLTQSLNIMAVKLKRQIDENRREQENLKKAELRTLQAQIAPHFLYNTLDAIVWLAESRRSDEVIRITRALSDFFRISLSQGKDWIPLSEEIKHLTGYLMIQKIRYSDILDYEIDIPEALYSQQVLKLLLQPLVENAIYHGVKHRRGRGRVTVTGRAEDGFLTLTVADNGAGMTPERLAEVCASLADDTAGEAGYGLYNVNKRIRLYYNQPRGVVIDSGAQGTTISIRVPMRG